MLPSNACKKLIIGIDEAGYGPNLGPLLIGASAWRVPRHMSDTQLTGLLNGTFRPAALSQNCQHVPLGDSKKLYHSGGGLSTLEAGLLAMLWLLGRTPGNVEQLLLQVAPPKSRGIDLSSQAATPWYDDLDRLPVPSKRALSDAEIDRLCQLARGALHEHDIELIDVSAQVITESHFNHQVARWGSKGLVLSQQSLELAEQTMSIHPGEATEIYCDRQGGRKNYLPLLLQWKPDAWFSETAASNHRCSYHATSAPLEIHFTVGGDTFPPTALASMVAKYLRERLMESFNLFWQQHLPDLKPTAGYPVDAVRFRDQIQQEAIRQSLPAECWWRCR